MSQYFYYEGNTQKGPVDFLELIKNITPETDIWTEGMEKWAKAKDVPEVFEALNLNAPNPPEIIPQQTNNYNKSNYSSEKNYQVPPDFQTLLVWAVVSNFLCCNITGIVGIIMTLRSEIEWTKGNYEQARKKYKDAKTWIIVGAILGFLAVITYTAFVGFVNVLPHLR